MNINNVLKEQKKILEIDKDILNYLKNEIKKFTELVDKEIIKEKVQAEVFVGGSFAKNTLIRDGDYDIDILVRFNWRFDDISGILKKVLKRICDENKYVLQEVHGSRDYYRIFIKRDTALEFIPVYQIKKPQEARNVTDLSYFHVNYVKRKLAKNKKLHGEILIAKKFCQAQNVYGAESYINGFSGYALECLIIHYGSFLKFVKEFLKIKERTVIDAEKKYKNKTEVLFSMNENKIQSPVVLVDPTWKDRNVLAALNWQTLRRFQDSASRFLKNPSADFFKWHAKDIEGMKKLAKSKNGEFVHLHIKTEKQEGDIAGTKMMKFSTFLKRELEKYFEILDNAFVYTHGKESDYYLAAKSRKEVIRIGPPITMKINAEKFKKAHKNVFEKNGYLHAKEKVDFSASSFLMKFVNGRKNVLKEMGISEMRVFK